MKSKSAVRRKGARKKSSARKTIRVKMAGKVTSLVRGTQRSAKRLLSSIGKAVW